MNPQHPIYVVSKGRWEKRLTSSYLHAYGVPHYIVVEEQERDAYAAHVDSSATLLVLDPAFKEQYELLDDLGLSKSTGPGPARNFAWAHALENGAEWHWVMDDNIWAFFRFNYNLKTPVGDGTIFRCMEDFVARYSNVAMAGPNYFMFAPRKTKQPPFVTNTRIYSCNLIRNDVPYRWRGRYNEDTILSLDMLSAGLATVQFNAFLQRKQPTQTMGGGNTEEFYAKEGTLAKSQMLADTYPDLAKVVKRFGRDHHQVNYKPFKDNKLILRPGVEIPDGFDNYGMVLQRYVDGKWRNDG